MKRIVAALVVSVLAASGCGRWRQDVTCERACALAVSDGGAPDSSFDDRRDPAEVDQALAKADEACSSRPDLKSLAEQARAKVEKARKKKAEEKAALEQARAEKLGDGGSAATVTATATAATTTTTTTTTTDGGAAAAIDASVTAVADAGK